jgi:deazaflavin-dependent oxidoreductase (nitroreductase family)
VSSEAKKENFLSRLKDSSEVRITVTGRKTGKKHSTPVWFLLEDKKVILVPTMGSKNNWFRNLEKNPQIELAVDRTSISAKATILRDSGQAKKTVEKLKAKYKSMWSDSYYNPRDVTVEIPL